ncbi:MAG TPA: DUF6766 family protein [Chthoniobacterales bacterium]
MRFVRDNSLSIVLLLSFFALWLGQSIAGRFAYNKERADENLPPLTYASYIASSHFWEATTENWESEFLQMFVYIGLTAFLLQRGSAESKDPNGENPEDEDPALHRNDPEAPWPVRHGGWVLWLYQYSLSLAFLTLFLVSIASHGWSSYLLYNEEQILIGKPTVDFSDYLQTSNFWFESLQNWQSEFLAVAAIVLLSIFLRHRGSPESKPVATPHWQTGE